MAYRANKIWNKILLLPRRPLDYSNFQFRGPGYRDVEEGRGARRKTGVLEMLLKNSIANNWSRFVEHCCRVCTRNFERANKTESHSTDFHETFGLSKRKRSEVYLHDRSTLQPASNRNFATVWKRWLQCFRVPCTLLCGRIVIRRVGWKYFKYVTWRGGRRGLVNLM